MSETLEDRCNLSRRCCRLQPARWGADFPCKAGLSARLGVGPELLPPQVAEMSCYSADGEITSVCADFLVELRGFEPRCSWGAFG